jgi:hypothetical protein
MKTNAKTGLKLKTGIKAGGMNASNHNRSGIRVKASVKAGYITVDNHNRTMLAA